MPTYDIKTDRRDLYAPKSADFVMVEVPPLNFLMVDGHGDPNTAQSYADALGALYAASYAIRAAAKSSLGRVHTVGPLEGLWSAADPGTFLTRDKNAWDWTLMIVQPEWITPELVDQGMTAARSKRLPALDLLRFQTYSEGLSAQILHRGPYDDEGPTLARLHQEFLPANGLQMSGRHHEIYLSDARRIEPGGSAPSCANRSCCRPGLRLSSWKSPTERLVTRPGTPCWRTPSGGVTATPSGRSTNGSAG